MWLLSGALFVLGAAGTGFGVWAFLGRQPPRTAVVSANTTQNATNTTTQLPPTTEHGERPTRTEEPAERTADPPSTNDEEASSEEDDAEAADEDDGSSSSRRRRRRDRDGNQAESQPAAQQTTPQQVLPPPVPQPVFRPAPPPPQAARVGISQGQVLGAVRQSLPRLRASCYMRIAQRVGPLQGVITVSFVVQSDGRAESIRVMHNGTGNEWLARCTEQFVRGTRFPPAANGLPTPVRYPFQFP
jgi:TonB family protein